MNRNSAKAAAAVEKLLARLRGGQVIITARISNFSASVRKLELDVLDIDAAAAFLLARTLDDRDHSADDATLARDLATELGGLALGLNRLVLSSRPSAPVLPAISLRGGKSARRCSTGSTNP